MLAAASHDLWSQRQDASDSVISPFSHSTSPSPNSPASTAASPAGVTPLCSALPPPPSATAGDRWSAQGPWRGRSASRCPLLSPRGLGLPRPSAEPGSVCTWAHTPFSHPRLEVRLPRGPGCLPEVLLLPEGGGVCVCVCVDLRHTCILSMTSPNGDSQGEESWVIQHPFLAPSHLCTSWVCFAWLGKCFCFFFLCIKV